MSQIVSQTTPMKKASHIQAIPKIILDTRRELKSESRTEDPVYPLKLRITWNRQRRYYKATSIALTEAEWIKIVDGKRLSREQREILEEIQVIESQASTVIKGLGSFSFDKFKEAFFIDHSIDRNSVYEAFDGYISQLKKEGRTSTAVCYNCALNSLKQFRSSLLFSDVTPSFLEAYEEEMLEEGRSQNTIGIYLRSLRAIMNKAKSQGIIDEESYPFGRKNHGKYQVPASQNVKKALTREEIQKIKDYSPEPGSRSDRAKDFWLFAYFTNGLNVTDIAYLKWENIDYEADMIRFVRKKTERANKGRKKAISAVLMDFTKQVIEKYKTDQNDQTDYVFPILKPSMTPAQVYRKIQDFTTTINKGMRVIAQELEINKKVTTYAARHSHATILLKSGASLEMIGENLGHTTLKTTQNYIASFDDETKKEMASYL